MARTPRTSFSASPAGAPPTPAGPDNPLRALIVAFGLVQRLMLPYFDRFGLTSARWGVLRTLHRAEAAGVPALRLKDLSQRMLIQPPGLSGVVARLARDRLVATTPDPGDRRVKLITLTRRGRAAVKRVLRAHPAQLQRLLGGLSTAQQADLLRLLNTLSRHLRTQLAAHAQPAGEARPRRRSRR